MAKKILVYWDITTEQQDQIRSIAAGSGWQVVFTTDPQTAVQEASDADILFGADLAPVKAAKNLKWFCTHTAGVNHILAPGVLPNDSCLVSNSAGAYGVSISEHILMVSLMIMRNFRQYDQVLTQKTWRHDIPMHSLYGSRITVLGTGDIGTTFARRVVSFDPAEITGVNRSGRIPSPVFSRVVRQDALSEVLPETDLLVMSLPETPETIHIMNKETLAMLPEGAYLVNVGRGSAIDEDALLSALNSGHLGGAALDVMQTEPLPSDSPLFHAKNLLLTPHTAGQMTLAHTQQKSVDMFCEDLDNYLNGRPLLHLVNKEIGY